MMNRLKNITAVVLVALIGTGGFSAYAQNAGDKKALATRLAQIQQKSDSESLAAQITGSATQPLLNAWSRKLYEQVPPAKQKEVRAKLDAELKKFTETTFSSVYEQARKTAESALVPVFMEKLSAEEMQTIITWLESPAAKKYQSLGAPASQAWIKKILDGTKSKVESGAKNFDAAAGKIVSGAVGKK